MRIPEWPDGKSAAIPDLSPTPISGVRFRVFYGEIKH
jgi:hypothetical protein